MTRYKTAVVLLLVALVACGRSAAIESEPGPVYVIDVENPMSHAMDIWYDDGVETTELGRVEPRSRREFVIAAPASANIEIIARDDGRTHTITRRADLSSGGTTIVLTP